MKVKFDKKLEKYHIHFNKKEEASEKGKLLKRLNSLYPLTVIFDTEVDNRKEEEREKNIEFLSKKIDSLGCAYDIKVREVESMKKIFGIPTMNRLRTNHYVFKTLLDKDSLDDELINFFLEHEMKFIYGDEKELYDSAIFMKFFADEDISKL